MTNENKNINELVSDDEDPTSELEAATFRQDTGIRAALSESDENTYDLDERAERAKRESRAIGKLQYDIEQLRARWIGVETELRAREEITEKLNAELSSVKDKLGRKEALLKERDGKIKTLKAEIREREQRHHDVTADLQRQLDIARDSVRQVPEPPSKPGARIESQGDAARLARIEDYADTLRRKLQDLLARYDETEKDRDRLSRSLDLAIETERKLEQEVAVLTLKREELESDLQSIGDRHAEEMRMLRFELGEAQDTVVQTEALNAELASDLVDTRNFKAELERMLTDSDEQARCRIEELEGELARVSDIARDLEEKLDARSDAINVLLAELARRSEQLQSIDDIGNVISDIDERIAEQFDEDEQHETPSPRSGERVTRVLLGKVGDKLLRFPLFKDRLTIGRTEDNDIQLNAPYISRRHAVVTTDGDKTRVVDWGSRNGVFVNSRRVTEHFLKNGDIVTIGNAHFRYDERPKRDS